MSVIVNTSCDDVGTAVVIVIAWLVITTIMVPAELLSMSLGFGDRGKLSNGASNIQ